MKLYASLTSPFARKPRIVALEKRIPLELVEEAPRNLDSNVQRLSALGQVPVLERDDGRPLYDSPIIVAYLDSLAEPALLPKSGEVHWEALRLEALADGLADAVVKWMMEGRRPKEQQSDDVRSWEVRRMGRVLAELERMEKRGGYLVDARFTTADIAAISALEYMDFRYSRAWRADYPGVAAYLAPLSKRPTCLETAPPQSA